jgi:hypothetical protein
VDVLAVRLKLEPSVAERDADDVLERIRLRARSLARSIFSRAVREVLALAALALLRCWDEGAVLDAAVMESRSLWNLRFEVAIASGIFATGEAVYVWSRLSGSRICEMFLEELLCLSRSILRFR